MTEQMRKQPDARVAAELDREKTAGLKGRNIPGLGLLPRNLQGLGLVPVIIVVGIIGTFVNSGFLTKTNLVDNILAFAGVLGVLVIAESALVIGGYFDLSIQSTVGFSVMLLAVLTTPSGGTAKGFGIPVALAVLIVLLVVVGIGLFNAFLVTIFNLSAFIVTLAMLILIEGFTEGLSNGNTYINLPGFINWLGSAIFLGIPVQGWIFVLVVGIAAAFMRFVPTGRAIYAQGGSVAAARAAGLNPRRITFGLFVFGSLMAFLAGSMLAGQTQAVNAGLGNNIIFTVFAAAVLGGIDLNGGRGTMLGAGLGVLLLTMVQDILDLSSVPSFWISAVYGAIILGALLVGKMSSLWPGLRRRA